MDLTKLKNTELFLFDMDGTLYLGDNVYEGAIELMEDLPRPHGALGSDERHGDGSGVDRRRAGNVRIRLFLPVRKS